MTPADLLVILKQRGTANRAQSVLEEVQELLKDKNIVAVTVESVPGGEFVEFGESTKPIKKYSATGKESNPQYIKHLEEYEKYRTEINTITQRVSANFKEIEYQGVKYKSNHTYYRPSYTDFKSDQGKTIQDVINELNKNPYACHPDSTYPRPRPWETEEIETKIMVGETPNALHSRQLSGIKTANTVTVAGLNILTSLEPDKYKELNEARDFYFAALLLGGNKTVTYKD